MHAQRQLRDDVFPSHVWAVNVMRTEDYRAPQFFATVIECKQLADNLAAGVGITRIQRVGNRQRNGFVRRHLRGCLVNFGARSDKQVANTVGDAGVEDVEHSFDCNFEDEIGLGIKKFCAVHSGEMTDRIHALNRSRDCSRITDIGVDPLNLRFYVAKTVTRSA